MTDAETSELLNRGFRYALSLAHDRQRAEDLLHDAWGNVLATNGPLTKRYLFRAIRNKWIDGHRRDNVVAFEPLETDVSATSRLEERLSARRSLASALGVLRPEEREALYLCAVEGWTAKEVAEQSGRPRNTVLSLVHRAKQKLRELLGDSQSRVNP